MAKPLIDDTRWGETTPGVESTQVTDPAATPASGLRDTGYVDHAKPTAKVWTRLFNRSHKWFKYLDAIIDGADNWTLPAVVTATGLINALAGLTAGANQHVTVSGTGDYKHGAREFGVSAMAFQSPNFNLGADISMDGAADTWNFGAATVGAVALAADLKLRVGDRITSIAWVFNKGSNASALGMSLTSVRGTTLTKNVRDNLSDVTSGASTVSVTRSGINYTIVSGDTMRLEVIPGNAAHKFSHCSVFYDHP